MARISSQTHILMLIPRTNKAQARWCAITSRAVPPPVHGRGVLTGGLESGVAPRKLARVGTVEVWNPTPRRNRKIADVARRSVISAGVSDARRFAMFSWFVLNTIAGLDASSNGVRLSPWSSSLRQCVAASK